MSEEEFRVKGKQIQDQLAKQLSDNLDIPVYSIDNETVDLIYEDLVEIEGVADNYSTDELRSEIQEFISHLLVARPANQEEFEDRIDEFIDSIREEKTFETILILPSVTGLPTGTKIGPLEIVEEGIEPEPFIEFLDYFTERRRIQVDKRTRARLEFQSYTTTDAPDTLFSLLELPFSIISLILDFDINPRDCFGYIHSVDTSKGFFLRPEREFVGLTSFRPDHHGDLLDHLSHITLQDRPTRLQEKILQAIQVYGLARLSRKPEIRFIFLVSSLESLLLTKGDRDYLGKKLAEKTAFLLESEYESRLELYRLMKRYYRKRSDIVHRGGADIGDHEVRTLQSIFRSLAFRLLELSNEYEKMEQKSHDKDKEGVEDLIHQIRFSGPK